jgi:queuine tRNA-ribosyltransferase
MDSLKLALRHPAWFKHLRHAGPNQILAENRWRSDDGLIDWHLLPGDFSERKFEAAPPDLIYFDPFSFKTDSALWTLRAFRELNLICADHAVELFTYTYSTRVRVAMLAAGFYVAKGRASGPKAETTIGLSPQAAGSHERELLGAEWLGRWRRSDAQAPFGGDDDDEGGGAWRNAVSGHPQFRDCG